MKEYTSDDYRNGRVPGVKPPALAVKPKRAPRGKRFLRSGLPPIAPDAVLGDAFVAHLPRMRLVSEANQCGAHWAGTRRKKIQRAAAERVVLATLAAFAVTESLIRQWEITIVRIAPRTLDTDNAGSSTKATRDGIADALGMDDGDPALRWIVTQEKGAPKTYAVRIELRPVLS